MLDSFQKRTDGNLETELKFKVGSKTREGEMGDSIHDDNCRIEKHDERETGYFTEHGCIMGKSEKEKKTLHHVDENNAVATVSRKGNDCGGIEKKEEPFPVQQLVDAPVKESSAKPRVKTEPEVLDLIDDSTGRMQETSEASTDKNGVTVSVRTTHSAPSGAAALFSSMSVAELSDLLGCNALGCDKLTNLSVQKSIPVSTDAKPLVEKPFKGAGNCRNSLDMFPKPDNSMMLFTTEEISSRWFFQTESGDFELVPKVPSKWMMKWLHEYKTLPPTFSPVVLPSDSRYLGPSGRTRTSKLLLDIRELCTGDFRQKGDFFRGFKCSWSSSSMHPCTSTLYVVACSSHVADASRTSVPVKCVFTEGCTHHQDDIGRGIVRSHVLEFKDGRIPNGMCHEHIVRTNPLAIATGNRTFGYFSTAAARQAQSRKRKAEFNRGEGILHSLPLVAEELASADFAADIHNELKLYGSVRDISVGNAGNLKSVSIYNDLSLRVMDAEFKKENSCALIDCSGKLVRDLWVSHASEMAKRSREGSSKKPKEVSADGKHVKFDVLNFHFAIPLDTGPFVGCEAVVIDRTAPTFINILSGLKRKLVDYGKDAHLPVYFVTDMSVPFAIAIVDVFNRITFQSTLLACYFQPRLETRTL